MCKNFFFFKGKNCKMYRQVHVDRVPSKGIIHKANGAMPFVQWKGDGFAIEPAAAQMLSTLEGKIAVVFMCGAYLTGKSYLLNCVAGNLCTSNESQNSCINKNQDNSNTKFPVATSVDPCTQGIWMQIPFRVGDTYYVLLDSAGLDTPKLNSYHEQEEKMCCLGLLLSSLFVIQTQNQVYEHGLEQLQTVVECARQMRLHITNTNVNNYTHSRDFFSSTSSSSFCSSTSPAFMWIVRDFVGPTMDTASNNSYLERILSLEPEYPSFNTTSIPLAPVGSLGTLGHSGPIESGRAYKYNHLRQAIIHQFPIRQCFTLVRPLQEEKDLQSLDKIPWYNLRLQFRTGVEEIRSSFLTLAKPKNIYLPHSTSSSSPNYQQSISVSLNGTHFVQLAQTFIDIINNGAVPSMTTSWQKLITESTISAMLEAKTVFKKTLLASHRRYNELLQQNQLVFMDENYITKQVNVALKYAYEVLQRRAISHTIYHKLIDQLQHETLEMVEEYKSTCLIELRKVLKAQLDHSWEQMNMESQFFNITVLKEQNNSYISSNCALSIPYVSTALILLDTFIQHFINEKTKELKETKDVKDVVALSVSVYLLLECAEFSKRQTNRLVTALWEKVIKLETKLSGNSESTNQLRKQIENLIQAAEQNNELLHQLIDEKKNSFRSKIIELEEKAETAVKNRIIECEIHYETQIGEIRHESRKRIMELEAEITKKDKQLIYEKNLCEQLTSTNKQANELCMDLDKQLKLSIQQIETLTALKQEQEIHFNENLTLLKKVEEFSKKAEEASIREKEAIKNLDEMTRKITQKEEENNLKMSQLKLESKKRWEHQLTELHTEMAEVKKAQHTEYKAQLACRQRDYDNQLKEMTDKQTVHKEIIENLKKEHSDVTNTLAVVKNDILTTLQQRQTIMSKEFTLTEEDRVQQIKYLENEYKIILDKIELVSRQNRELNADIETCIKNMEEHQVIYEKEKAMFITQLLEKDHLQETLQASIIKIENDKKEEAILQTKQALEPVTEELHNSQNQLKTLQRSEAARMARFETEYKLRLETDLIKTLESNYNTRLAQYITPQSEENRLQLRILIANELKNDPTFRNELKSELQTELSSDIWSTFVPEHDIPVVKLEEKSTENTDNINTITPITPTTMTELINLNSVWGQDDPSKLSLSEIKTRMDLCKMPYSKDLCRKQQFLNIVFLYHPTLAAQWEVVKNASRKRQRNDSDNDALPSYIS